MVHIIYLTIITILSLVLLMILIMLFHSAQEEHYLADKYKADFFNEQLKSKMYRACLYVAINDMIDNKWYKSPSEAFRMLRCRVKPYKFDSEFDTVVLIATMLYWGNTIKLSPDYEQELLDREEDGNN